MAKRDFSRAKVNRAAGGLVVRDAEVLVVHRPRYDDWSFPKGHVDDGESWAETALREVWEETGVSARVTDDRPRPVVYPVGDALKVVVFFAMTPIDRSAPGPDVPRPQPVDHDEVDRVEWWPYGFAEKRLSYSIERGLVAELRNLAAHD